MTPLPEFHEILAIRIVTIAAGYSSGRKLRRSEWFNSVVAFEAEARRGQIADSLQVPSRFATSSGNVPGGMSLDCSHRRFCRRRAVCNVPDCIALQSTSTVGNMATRPEWRAEQVVRPTLAAVMSGITVTNTEFGA